jgi:hypothetical protein
MRPTLPPLLLLSLVACEPEPVPAQPTWADVEPILRGHCTHCHGASADVSAKAGDTVYRFDFFEVSAETCGEAAQALDGPEMAHGWAPLIEAAITPPAGGGRARMPPAPASALSEREQETLVRWARSPSLGVPPRDNHRPRVEVTRAPAASVDAALEMTVLVEDPDGESVVGVLRVGDETVRLTGPGAFTVSLDTSAWPEGAHAARAVLCDGWDEISYALPEVVVAH